jgi:hypothetical protein
VKIAARSRGLLARVQTPERILYLNLKRGLKARHYVLKLHLPLL